MLETTLSVQTAIRKVTNLRFASCGWALRFVGIPWNRVHLVIIPLKFVEQCFLIAWII